MLISIVIPHFNQEDHLRTCLKRLQAQKGGLTDVEIIVVDNGSRRMPDAVCAEIPAVRLLSETTPGPGPARNRGAAVAQGDVLAFIDADCHADPGWLAAMKKPLPIPRHRSSVAMFGSAMRFRVAPVSSNPTRRSIPTATTNILLRGFQEQAISPRALKYCAMLVSLRASASPKTATGACARVRLAIKFAI